MRTRKFKCMEKPRPTFRDLYPHMTEEELRIAEENFDDYLRFALEVYDDLRADPEAYKEFLALTKQKPEV